MSPEASAIHHLIEQDLVQREAVAEAASEMASLARPSARRRARNVSTRATASVAICSSEPDPGCLSGPSQGDPPGA